MDPEEKLKNYLAWKDFDNKVKKQKEKKARRMNFMKLLALLLCCLSLFCTLYALVVLNSFLLWIAFSIISALLLVNLKHIES